MAERTDEQNVTSQMEAHDYHVVSSIGVGAYGMVYKGCRKADPTDVVALKRTKIENFNDGIPSTTMREISILNELDHENIVKLKSVIQTKDCIWFVQEFCNIDLSKLLRDTPGPLSAGLIKSLMRQLLEGVRYMHESRIMHRDLKPPNLLLTGDQNDKLKIADFGLARAFSIPIKPYTKEVVTLYYRAPELLLKMHEYATPVDIWSVGCIFAELALKHQLFQGQNDRFQLDMIFRLLGTPTDQVWEGITANPMFASIKWNPYQRQNFRDFIREEQIDDAGLDLMYKMLEYEPIRRITARQALEHPYFKEKE